MISGSHARVERGQPHRSPRSTRAWLRSGEEISKRRHIPQASEPASQLGGNGAALSNLGQFVALAARPVDQFVGFVAIGKSLGGRIPLQLLADAADVTDDIHQVA